MATQITGLELDAGAEVDADEHQPQTEEEHLAMRVVSQLRQDHPKAACVAAVELVRLISRNHDLGVAIIE